MCDPNPKKKGNLSKRFGIFGTSEKSSKNNSPLHAIKFLSFKISEILSRAKIRPCNTGTSNSIILTISVLNKSFSQVISLEISGSARSEQENIKNINKDNIIFLKILLDL